SEVMLYRIMHEAPNLSAVPPTLRPLVEAALAKDQQARPTAPQLLHELTRGAAVPAGAQPAPGLDNPTQTILAQNWHPSATAVPSGYPPATGGHRSTAEPPPRRPGSHRARPGLRAGRRRHRPRPRPGQRAPHPERPRDRRVELRQHGPRHPARPDRYQQRRQHGPR